MTRIAPLVAASFLAVALIFGGLWLLLAPAAPPSPPPSVAIDLPSPVPVSAKLGVSADDVRSVYPFVSFETAPSVDGAHRLLGTNSSETVTVELIGDSRDLSSVALITTLPADNDAIAKMHADDVVDLFALTMGTDAKAGETWFLGAMRDNIERLGAGLDPKVYEAQIADYELSATFLIASDGTLIVISVAAA